MVALLGASAYDRSMATPSQLTPDRLSGIDLSRVNSLARRYVTGREPKAIDEVAELLELCISPEEAHRILWWWNEGCRDYAKDMRHLAELDAELPARRAELYPNS